MKFGNWKVSEAGIEWSDRLQRFVIEHGQLLETAQEPGEANGLYQWILLATAEDWLTHDDLYDLNYAFVFAAAGAGGSFDYERFERTLDYQYGLLEEEEKSQPSLGGFTADDAEAEQQRKEALSERD